MSETLVGACNAPCVINATGSFMLAYCDQEKGHPGHIHSRTLPGESGSPDAKVTWWYVGHSDEGGISFAPPLGENRCDERVYVGNLVGLTPDLPADQETRNLFSLQDNTKQGYCCQLPPQHIQNEHSRFGIFKPFGMVWRVMW